MLSWLHISDLHFSTDHEYEQELILDSLVEAVSRFQRRGKCLDLVFVSGDIASTGQENEYAGATRFFDALLGCAGLGRGHLFIVPGNHDINRQAAKGLARSLASEEESLDFFGPDHPRHHLAKLRAFRHWHDEYFAGFRSCSQETACALPELVEVGKHRLAVLPINTAIFAVDDSDHGKLWVGRRWLQGALETVVSMGSTDLTVALQHHPCSWLHDEERSNIRALLQAHVDIVLRGHLHENELVDATTGGGRCLYLAAGAAYQPRRYPQMALMTTVEPGTRTVRVLPIRYQDKPQEVWTVDTSLFPEADSFEGVFFLDQTGDVTSAPDRQTESPSMRSRIAALLAEQPHLHDLFRCEEHVARSDDDEASLALIAAIIEQEAREEIRVIGRGPQMVDTRTSNYLTAVAKSIINGVTYRRILILDSNLPQNGLLWLLLLERFLHSPIHRGQIFLHVLQMPFTHNMNPQFQIVDGTYLHRTSRFYSPDEPGAARQAQSIFAVSPSEEVSQAHFSYQQYLGSAGRRYTHLEVTRFLERMLNDLKPGSLTIAYHWKLLLQVIDFLEGLGVPGLPSRGICFIGCLMPFTYTHQAAMTFVEREADGKTARIVPLPFGSLDDAIEQFLDGRLDYVCVPVANTRIGTVAPPLENPGRMEGFHEKAQKLTEIDVQISFVLAAVHSDSRRWKELVAVDPAYLQVEGCLPQEAACLARYVEERAQSNYHAACLAREHGSLVAITTREAAHHLGLHICGLLEQSNLENKTTFAVYAQKESREVNTTPS